MQIVLFIALFIAFIAALFALQNSDVVQVSFLLWKFQSSLAAILLVTLAVGALISTLVSLPASVKNRWILRQQRKKLSDLEARLAEVETQLDAATTLQAESFPVLPEPAQEVTPVLAAESQADKPEEEA